MEKEKFVAEFDVEKEVEIRHGIVEKHLSRLGEKTPFKALVKNEDFVTIVGRRYKVIPNEDFEILCARVADVLGYDYTIERIGWRSYVHIEGDDFGLVCGNSIDSSMGLWADGIVKFGGVRAITTKIPVAGYQTIYAKHTNHISDVLSEFQDVLTGIVEVSEQYRNWILKTKEYKIGYELREDIIEMLETDFPKKYVKDAVNILKHRGCDLFELYKPIAESIYGSEKLEVKSKRLLFGKLNDFVMTVQELLG